MHGPVDKISKFNLTASDDLFDFLWRNGASDFEFTIMRRPPGRRTTHSCADQVKCVIARKVRYVN